MAFFLFTLNWPAPWWWEVVFLWSPTVLGHFRFEANTLLAGILRNVFFLVFRMQSIEKKNIFIDQLWVKNKKNYVSKSTA